MSSDYIPRLRAELVRAAERRQPRWRRVLPSLRPLIAIAAVALLVAAVVIAVDRGGARSDEREYSVAAAAAERAADVMRDRLELAGVEGASVSVSDGRLLIDAPPEARAALAVLTQPGEFAAFDWETGVLGPDGKPAPRDPDVTGGEDSGFGAGTSRREAEARVAAAGGGRVVRTPASVPERWVALGGAPALTSADIASAQPAKDMVTGMPSVMLEFTDGGRDAFSELTRAVTRRGADAGRIQHFAMLIDDRIVALPYVDHRQNPDGIQGADGAQISGGMTTRTARWIAALLDSGPLPAAIRPATG